MSYPTKLLAFPVTWAILFLELRIVSSQHVEKTSGPILSHLENSTTVTSDPNNLNYEWDSSESITGSDESPVLMPNGSTQSIPINLTEKAFLWTKHAESYTSSGRSLKGHTILTVPGKKFNSQCVFECLKNSRCQSTNFDHITSVCELNNSSHTDYPQDLVQVKAREYHTKGAYSIETAALGVCGGDPCNRHGRCLETRSITGGVAALCLCDDGLSGTSCSIADPGPQWSAWMDWSVCSVTCQRGWRERRRECTDSMDLRTLNPTLCYGYPQEYEVCELHSCPVWESWGAWGECSTVTSCGRGIKVRSRACSNHGKVGVDRYCLGLSEETTSCYSVACIGRIQLVGGSSLGEGRVQLFDDDRDRWAFICANQMTEHIADRACRQAGWPGGHSDVTEGRYGSVSGEFALSFINCTGAEAYLAGCQHNSWAEDTVCTDGTTLPGGVQCNVDGVWSLWSAWTACSVTCENGTQTRTRRCDHPHPKHDGKQCRGEDIQHKPCSLPMCPVDGVWNAWSDWSDCTVTCSWGWQWRNRTCNGPYYSGAPCQGTDNETQTCNLRHCPVDGYWKEWGTWSDCSLTCGGGTRGRVRECHLGQYGGKNCTGNTTESDSCNEHHCPVDGIWINWSDWAECSLSCGNGTQTRNRSCEGPFYGGTDCVGQHEDVQSCNTQACPVDGIFSSWMEWSECTLTCGSGIQRRDRICIGPFHGGTDCQGDFSETKRCNEHPCPIDGYYGDWMTWSSCTVTCGGGKQQRNRTCTPPKYGGQNCQGPDNMMQECSTQHCPVNGLWLEWSVWSACNATCGGGHQRRTRKCQEPQYGGLPCVGVTSEYLVCGENSCEIPGEWFPWHSWTSCTATCGGGTRQRKRECDMTTHKDLTAPCVGLAEETVNCHTFSCLPFAHTCTELGERGLIENVQAEIDPDGPGTSTLESVTVFCDMTSHNGIGVTVIGHDQETRRQVQGWEGAREYEVELMYNVSFDHVLSIIDQSNYCEQYISWECFAALMHNYNDNNKVTTGWLNRTRGVADYFGGATPGSHSCACGMNHSCADPTFLCNCDANDEIWRKDDGYLIYKEDLPVYAFVAGDTGGEDEEGYSQIGPLRCQG